MATFLFSAGTTQNITSGGEGGTLIVKNQKFLDRIEMVREKGTDRKQFIDGLIDKYTWKCAGGSLLMPEICAGILRYQLGHISEVNNRRAQICNVYDSELREFFDTAFSSAKGVGHVFGVAINDLEEKLKFTTFLDANEIGYAYHYTSLAKTPKGLQYGTVSCPVSDFYAAGLIRFPVYFNLTDLDLEITINVIRKYFKHER